MKLNPDLFLLPQSEVDAYGEENLIYGSLTAKGLASFSVALLQWTTPDQIEGMDFGCGDGEFVYQVEQALPGSVWHGVELCESRIAKQVHSVNIWQGDFFEESLHSYNVIHADNLCLQDALAERLEKKVLEEFRGIYVSYRTPTYIEFLRKSRLLSVVPVETTWTSQHFLHFYLLD